MKEKQVNSIMQLLHNKKGNLILLSYYLLSRETDGIMYTDNDKYIRTEMRDSDNNPVYGGGHIGRHNICGKRYDIWFTLNDIEYHGVSYGTGRIVYCKAIKGKNK